MKNLARIVADELELLEEEVNKLLAQRTRLEEALTRIAENDTELTGDHARFFQAIARQALVDFKKILNGEQQHEYDQKRKDELPEWRPQWRQGHRDPEWYLDPEYQGLRHEFQRFPPDPPVHCRED